MNQTLSTLLIIGLFANEGQAVEAGQADAATQDYSRLPVQQAVLHSPTWQALQRFPALYPLSAAMKHVEGCATVEYVVTPQNEVADLKLIAATDKRFAVEAVKVVKQWPWSNLTKGSISAAVKTQTRFEFCFDEPQQSCESKAKKSVCPGEDVIFSAAGRLN